MEALYRIPALPPGVGDRVGPAAERLRELEARLVDRALAWGYRLIQPPTFEYAALLEEAGDPGLLEKAFRFADRDGRLLALRADFTPAVARIVAQRLADRPPPLRFVYGGSVFRDEPTQAGRQREFRQVGIELIGVPAPAADAEVLDLAADLLTAVGLKFFTLVVGHVGAMQGILAALDLPEGEAAALLTALDRKNRAEALARVRGHAGARRLLEAILTGGEDPAWLETLPRLLDRPEVVRAVEELTALWQALEDRGTPGRRLLDLTEVQGMAYYTGIVFKGYAPGLGFHLCGGGRYDRLLARFGMERPAVGFAVGLERLELALAAQGEEGAPPPRALVQGCGHRACRARVAELRAQGWRIEEDLAGRDPSRLRGYAAAVGIRTLWLCEGPGRLRRVSVEE